MSTTYTFAITVNVEVEIDYEHDEHGSGRIVKSKCSIDPAEGADYDFFPSNVNESIQEIVEGMESEFVDMLDEEYEPDSFETLGLSWRDFS
jgi:hypothetical protein